MDSVSFCKPFHPLKQFLSSFTFGVQDVICLGSSSIAIWSRKGAHSWHRFANEKKAQIAGAFTLCGAMTPKIINEFRQFLPFEYNYQIQIGLLFCLDKLAVGLFKQSSDWAAIHLAQASQAYTFKSMWEIVLEDGAFQLSLYFVLQQINLSSSQLGQGWGSIA